MTLIIKKILVILLLTAAVLVSLSCVAVSSLTTETSNPPPTIPSVQLATMVQETATFLPVSTETSSPIGTPISTPTYPTNPSVTMPTLAPTLEPVVGTGKELLIGYSYSSEFADYFNSINRPDDFVAVGLPGLGRLSSLAVGRRVLMFSSLDRMKSYPPETLDQVDYIGFDLERGAVPANEQADLVSTVQQAADFAKQHNLGLLLAPVAPWTEQYGEQMVPFADVIVMQMMRYQADPALCAAKIRENSQRLQAANPEILVFVQLSTQRDQTPAELFECIAAAQDELDGVWIQWHYRDEGSGPKGGSPNIGEVQEFIGLIRPKAQ